MRTILAGLLLAAFSFVSYGADAPPPLAISLDALGDKDQAVVTRVSFRFATPPEVPPETGLFLQGTFLQGGQVARNFRVAVPPDLKGPISVIQAFAPGEVEVEVRLIMPIDEGAPVMINKTSAKFTVAATGKVYVASASDGAEAILAEGIVPENVGAVTIRVPQRDVALNLFRVEVDVQPPVTRVEFWVDGKRVLARNAPPYATELDLGKLPKRVEVRAVGFDATGRYIDADAFIVNERETPLEVKITRTATPDGLTHVKLSLQNSKNRSITTVALFVDAKKVHEWNGPPYAIDLTTASLVGAELLRASVIDETGYEAADILFLSGDRFMESIEVNLVELPVSVTDANGGGILGLEAKDFSVFENGKPQKISSFNFAENLPISVGLLVDHSGSMVKRIDEARAAAIDFFKSALKKGDQAFVGAFASDPARAAPFVSTAETLTAQINAIPEAHGTTALYDAIVTGLYRFRNVQGRKALIIISDGADTTSRLTYADMQTYARSSRVPLYFVGIGFGFMDRGGVNLMKELAAETGGMTYFVDSSKDLPAAYKLLEKDLRTQYLVSYETESSSKDQAYRTVEVKVARPDAKVRTIRGYIP